jgi:hypothetical protein
MAGRVSIVGPTLVALAGAIVLALVAGEVRIVAQKQAGASTVTTAAKAAHDQRYKRLLITNAMVIYGNAKPPYGPMEPATIAGGAGPAAQQAGKRRGRRRGAGARAGEGDRRARFGDLRSPRGG